MAIVQVAQGTDPYGGTMPISLNIPGTADFFIIVLTDLASPTVTGTLGGQTLQVKSGGSAWYYGQVSTRVLYLVAPPTGASVSLNMSTDGIVVSWAAFSGVHQTTPFAGSGTEEFASTDESTPLDTADTIASATGELVLQLVASINGTGTYTGLNASNGATVVAAINDVGQGVGIASKAGAASVTLGLVPTGSGITYWSFGARTLRLAEAGGGATTYDRTVNETVTITDTAALQSTVLSRTFNETITLGDTASTAGITDAFVGETVSITDQFGIGFDYLLGTELISLIDTVSASIVVNRTVNETISLTDTAGQNTNFNFTVNETISIVDTPSAGIAGVVYDRTVNETISITDTASYFISGSGSGSGGLVGSGGGLLVSITRIV